MSVVATPRSTPLDRRDYAFLTAANTVGLLLVSVGWAAVSARADFAAQLPWATLGLTGLLIGLCGQVAFVLRFRRIVGVRIRRRFGHGVPRGAARIAAPVPVAAVDVVAGPGLRRYHRRDCPPARDQDWPARTVAEHRANGLEPCGVCRP